MVQLRETKSVSRSLYTKWLENREGILDLLIVR